LKRIGDSGPPCRTPHFISNFNLGWFFITALAVYFEWIELSSLYQYDRKLLLGQ